MVVQAGTRPGYRLQGSFFPTIYRYLCLRTQSPPLGAAVLHKFAPSVTATVKLEVTPAQPKRSGELAFAWLRKA